MCAKDNGTTSRHRALAWRKVSPSERRLVALLCRMHTERNPTRSKEELPKCVSVLGSFQVRRLSEGRAAVAGRQQDGCRKVRWLSAFRA